MFHEKIRTKHAAGIIASIAWIGFGLSLATPAGASTLHQHHLHHLRVIGAGTHLVSAPMVSTAASTSLATPGGSFGQCVVARESGGNPQITNATGHWGLYQFSAATWAAYGGSPADFGSAGVAAQNQVFANALAQGGQSNWSPYDGC